MPETMERFKTTVTEFIRSFFLEGTAPVLLEAVRSDLNRLLTQAFEEGYECRVREEFGGEPKDSDE